MKIKTFALENDEHINSIYSFMMGESNLFPIKGIRRVFRELFLQDNDLSEEQIQKLFKGEEGDVLDYSGSDTDAIAEIVDELEDWSKDGFVYHVEYVDDGSNGVILIIQFKIELEVKV